MNKTLSKGAWYFFCLLCTLIGLYPIAYFIIDRQFGLLSTKSQIVLTDFIWNCGFYSHIILGGIALLIGWTQFSSKLRKNNIQLHRRIGKVYIITVFISGIAAIYIAQFATGGITNVIGFSLMALFWLSTTFMAYSSIKKGNVKRHENFMTYSYALCFSAVTLRIWLPILIGITGDFMPAYQIVGWLCWVPNLIVAFLINNRRKNKLSYL